MENTTSYREDFAQDVAILKEAANSTKIEDRTFYWLSRPCGTWCIKEKDIFLKDSLPYNIWTYYESEHEHIKAFRVVIERTEGRKLIGQLIPFDYGANIQRIRKAALPIWSISGEYVDGVSFSMSYSEYGSEAHERICKQHGGVKDAELFPENKDELKLRIAQEHTMQTRKSGPKKDKGKYVSR